MANTPGSGKGAGYTMQQPSAYGDYGSLGMGNFGMRSDQPQRSVSPFSSKGGGSRSQFNEQLYNLPGFSDSLQSSQQRMAQDPNANMMRTQPALPIAANPVARPAQPQDPMSIDDFARSGLMGPTTQEFRNPIEFEGSMRDPALVSAYQSYIGGDQQRMAQNPMGMQGDAFRAQQMTMDALNQARQAGLQVGPTPGQPPNPYASMPVPQRQQMNEQIRMQQMMQQRMMQQRQMMNDQMRQRQMMAQRRPYGGAFNPYGGYSRVGIGSLMPFMFRQGY